VAQRAKPSPLQVELEEPGPLPTPTITKLIVNSPYRSPTQHWRYDTSTQLFNLEPGRRPAGYVVATPGAKPITDPGTFVELPLVNKIRTRVDDWRASGYPGVTSITRRLIDHWRDPEQNQDRRSSFVSSKQSKLSSGWRRLHRLTLSD
jgi:hypothetical protein